MDPRFVGSHKSSMDRQRGTGHEICTTSLALCACVCSLLCPGKKSLLRLLRLPPSLLTSVSLPPSRPPSLMCSLCSGKNGHHAAAPTRTFAHTDRASLDRTRPGTTSPHYSTARNVHRYAPLCKEDIHDFDSTTLSNSCVLSLDRALGNLRWGGGGVGEVTASAPDVSMPHSFLS